MERLGIYARACDVAAVKQCLDEGVDPNACPTNSSSPLLLTAAESGSVAFVRMLLEYGASPNVTVTTGAERGRTPLHGACYSGKKNLIPLLVDAGADLDVVSEKEGFTALHWAIFTQNDEIVEMLVNYGANVTITNKEGKTPQAISRSFECIIHLQRRKGKIP